MKPTNTTGHRPTVNRFANTTGVTPTSNKNYETSAIIFAACVVLFVLILGGLMLYRAAQRDQYLFNHPEVIDQMRYEYEKENNR